MKDKRQPSEKIQAHLAALLSDPGTSEDLLSQLSLAGLQSILQHGVEAEADEYLGRRRYSRQPRLVSSGDPTGADRQPEDQGDPLYRNGYQRRTLKTRQGRVSLEKPRIRQGSRSTTFKSQLLAQLDRIEAQLRKLSIEMYVRGLSTRDIEETLVDQDGKPLLSRSSVSRINEDLYREYEAFTSRDLSGFDVVYLFMDGVYESVKKYTRNQTILCAWAICSDGSKQMLHLAAVESESQRAWEQFIEEMQQRGLRHPLLVTSDGGKGLQAATTRMFPSTERQRCIAHKLRNLLSKLPEDAQAELQPQIHAIYYAPDLQAAHVLAQAFIERYAERFPAMIQCFNDDLEACLVHLKYPPGHRRFIRTTNLLERCFEEEKRRTKTIPAHVNERGAIQLVFGVLWRVSKRWQKVKMSSLELTQLQHLRQLRTHNTGTKDEQNNYISFRLAA